MKPPKIPCKRNPWKHKSEPELSTVFTRIEETILNHYTRYSFMNFSYFVPGISLPKIYSIEKKMAFNVKRVDKYTFVLKLLLLWVLYFFTKKKMFKIRRKDTMVKFRFYYYVILSKLMSLYSPWNHHFWWYGWVGG